MKKIISMLILLCLVIPFMFACGNGEVSQEATSSEEIPLNQGFLAEEKNWNGETVNILGHNGMHQYHSIQIEGEEDGDSIGKAVFERNKFIKDNYGIEIKLTLPEEGNEPIRMLREDISSGLNEYQAIVCPSVYIGHLAGEGLLKDLNEADPDILHLNEAWWDKNIIDDLTIKGKTYFLASNTFIDSNETTWAMYFNKDVMDAYSIEDDLYQLVRDGKWTYDKMYEMIKKVDYQAEGTKTYKDSLDVGSAQWGMVLQSYDVYSFMQAGMQTTIDNKGDTLALRFLEQENVNAFKKLAEIIYDEKNVGLADYQGRWNEGIYEQEKQIFAVGNSLFMPHTVSTLNDDVIKESSANIGIIPMPKVNEAQERYCSSIAVYHFPVIAIPESNKSKFDVTCYALEAMAFYGSKLVTPEYYQSIYDSAPLANEENSDILDMIFNNRIYDVAVCYNIGSESTSFLYCYTDSLGNKDSDIVKRFEKRLPSYQARLDVFMEDFAD